MLKAPYKWNHNTSQTASKMEELFCWVFKMPPERSGGEIKQLLWENSSYQWGCQHKQGYLVCLCKSRTFNLSDKPVHNPLASSHVFCSPMPDDWDIKGKCGCWIEECLVRTCNIFESEGNSSFRRFVMLSIRTSYTGNCSMRLKGNFRFYEETGLMQLFFSRNTALVADTKAGKNWSDPTLLMSRL